MGFKARRRNIKLVFPEDSRLHGLEITIRGLTFGELRDLQEEEKAVESVTESQDVDIRYFVRHVDSWNLEGEDSKVLPITEDSLRNSLEYPEIQELIRTWSQEVLLSGGVSRPLESRPDGGSSTESTPNIEGSIPMDNQ